MLDFNPIQYHTPLYQGLARRGNVELDVLFLTDRGYRPSVDSSFGVTVSWDIDLLSGYSHGLLRTTERPSQSIRGLYNSIRILNSWIKSQEIIVIHGYANPWMLYAIVACRLSGTPYLLRGDSQRDSQASGLRRIVRNALAHAVVSRSSGGLAIGQLNAQFYHRYGAPRITFAPYSVDDQRFGSTPACGRSELLARWGLPDSRPVIMFCGKLYPGKRPLDLASAVRLLSREVTVLFVGDGILADELRASLIPGQGVVTGFLNQSELPSYYHAADIFVLPSEAEKWGLVVNEAMAAGVLPVVSDRVGAAPDLVRDIGEVYTSGNVIGLAEALNRALGRLNPETRDRVRKHVARYSLDRTVDGFEQAALMGWDSSDIC